MQTNFDSISPEYKAHLQGDVLHLPQPTLNPVDMYVGETYFAALHNHAIPIVEMLAQIQELGVKRTNMQIADFSSEKGGEDLVGLYDYNNNLARAITDLARAAGLKIAIDRKTDGSTFQCPQLIQKALLSSINLPPFLQKRIEERKETTMKELEPDPSTNTNPSVTTVTDGQVKSADLPQPPPSNVQKQPQTWRRAVSALLHRSDKGGAPDQQQAIVKPVEIKSEPLKVEVQPPARPDFTLKIFSKVDEASYKQGYHRSRFSYETMNSEISLIPTT